MAELGESLSHRRDRLAAAARGCGVWLVPSGLPPLGGAAIVSNGDRFAPDTGYLSYFDDVPAPVIAVVNTMSLFGCTGGCGVRWWGTSRP